MKKMIRMSVGGLLMAGALASAQAGEFNTRYYGPARGSDVVDQVTDAFTTKYPSQKWSLYLHSSAGMNAGVRYCTAIAGVVPKGSHDFPNIRYEAVTIFPEKGSVSTEGEKRELAVICARSAVQNMMSDRPDQMYEANPK